MLIHLYAVYTWEQDDKADAEAPLTNGHANGHINGYTRVDRRVRDAEEFELEGLDSDDDDEDSSRLNKEPRSLAAQH